MVWVKSSVFLFKNIGNFSIIVKIVPILNKSKIILPAFKILVKRDNGPAAATAQHDAILRVGQQAAQLAGRGDVWNQQQNATQGDGLIPGILPIKTLLKSVTTKAIYTSRMSDLLVPPKVELKFPLANFPGLVYSRMNYRVLEARQRDVSYSVIHGLYRNRDRLF